MISQKWCFIQKKGKRQDYARIDGDYSYNVYDDNDGEGPYSTGSWDMRWARFAVVDYPREDYEKECDRLS